MDPWHKSVQIVYVKSESFGKWLIKASKQAYMHMHMNSFAHLANSRE